jgi:hypothetical protein
MKLGHYFRKEHELKDTNYKMVVELSYSKLHRLGGNKDWFCRIWVGYHHQYFYSDNKYNAYRQAYNKVKYLIKQ